MMGKVKICVAIIFDELVADALHYNPKNDFPFLKSTVSQPVAQGEVCSFKIRHDNLPPASTGFTDWLTCKTPHLAE